MLDFSFLYGNFYYFTFLLYNFSISGFLVLSTLYMLLFMCICITLGRSLIQVIVFLLIAFLLSGLLLCFYGLEYLGFVYILIYAGAVAILFVFLVFLLNLDFNYIGINPLSVFFLLVLTPILAIVYINYLCVFYIDDIVCWWKNIFWVNNYIQFFGGQKQYGFGVYELGVILYVQYLHLVLVIGVFLAICTIGPVLVISGPFWSARFYKGKIVQCYLVICGWWQGGPVVIDFIKILFRGFFAFLQYIYISFFLLFRIFFRVVYFVKFMLFSLVKFFFIFYFLLKYFIYLVRFSLSYMGSFIWSNFYSFVKLFLYIICSVLIFVFSFRLGIVFLWEDMSDSFGFLRLGPIFICVFFFYYLLFYLSFSFEASKYVRIKSYEQSSPYECGFAPFESSRSKFEVHYFLVAILFLIFDIEIAYLYPYIIVMELLSFDSVFILFCFLFVLGFGFIYEWFSGILFWSEEHIDDYRSVI